MACGQHGENSDPENHSTHFCENCTVRDETGKNHCVENVCWFGNECRWKENTVRPNHDILNSHQIKDVVKKYFEEQTGCVSFRVYRIRRVKDMWVVLCGVLHHGAIFVRDTFSDIYKINVTITGEIKSTQCLTEDMYIGDIDHA